MRKSRKAADVLPNELLHIVEAPSRIGGARIVKTPEWLLTPESRGNITTHIEIDMTDEAPDEFIDAWKAIGGQGDTDERKAYNARRLWLDILPMLASHGTAPLFYKFAEGNGVWAEAAKMIGVRKNGEAVSWYDLDGGHVQWISLWDLAFRPQPFIPREGEALGRFHREPIGRKLFMMTDEMWENGDYPPEVGGRTTSKEARLKRRRRA